ncbi:MAG: transcriptional repressor [Desulfobacteraceae bacterium]|jgi:Fur family ferric uptake transcriptional regulator
MKNNNRFEKANFRALIEGDSLGDIEKRLDVIDVFLDTEEHVTLEELMQLLRQRGCDYETSFVRQCMNRWVDLGFAQKEHFDGQPPRYEHRHLGKHHDHIICTKCGKIVEFSNDEMERLQVRIAALQGFHILQHKMEIYGLCSECLNQRRPLMPLAMAKPGEKIVIKEMMGGREARARLASMGLRAGDSLEIINNNGLGRLIVGHSSTRLAMGRGIAQKIMVTLDTEDKEL